MSETIQIKLTEEAKALLRSLKTWDARLMAGICRGMDKANAIAVSNIQKKHLSFPKTGPTQPDGLRVQSGRLRSAAWASAAVATGTTVTSSIGDNVKYAAIHEFGGTIHHEARMGTARLKADAKGRLLRQKATEKLAAHIAKNLAVFAGKGAKRIKKVDYVAKAHDVEMPERAMFRTGIQEVLEQYGRIVSAEILKARPAQA